MLFMTGGFCLVELIVGNMTGSVALVADAFHMLSDVLSLVIALYAIKLAKQTVHQGNYSYGWQRAEIVGALINGVFLMALCFSIFMEALERFLSPKFVENPRQVLIVGGAGLAVNIIGLFLFHDHGHDHGHGHSHGGGHEHAAHDHAAHDHDHEHEHDDHSAADVHLHIDCAKPSAPAPAVTRPSPSPANLSPIDPSVSTPDAQFASSSPPTQVMRMGKIVQIVSGCDSHELGVVNQHRPSATSSTLPPYQPSAPPYHSHVDEEARAGSDGDDHGASKSKTSGMNMRGVFLHVMGDALGSVAVMISAGLAWALGGASGENAPEWVKYVDPAVSLIITGLILASTIPLVRRAASVLLQVAPASIDLHKVTAQIAELEGVVGVHELHVWELADEKNVATVHVALAQAPEHDCHRNPRDSDQYHEIAAKIKKLLHTHNVHSVTIQPEFCVVHAAGDAPSGASAGARSGGGDAHGLACQFRCPKQCRTQVCCSGDSTNEAA
ncbi:cation diffusion facilitator family transporter, partial [Allomyces macrogynus ATCC 38327]